MMLEVQSIRATNLAPGEGAMSLWTSYSLALPIDSASTYNSSKKRKRDSFEAYDFQVHRHQNMRYSLLRNNPLHHQVYPQPTMPHELPHHSPETFPDNARDDKRYFQQSPTPEYHSNPSVSTRSIADNIRKSRRKKSSKKSSSRRPVRMTRKHYNKKKRLEMMEATDCHIQRILASCQCCIRTPPSPKLRFVRRMAEHLDLALRDQCNSIVQKEQDIKSWLGMTTRSKSKIVKLRKRLHDRWTEVKDLQSAVKPQRQRLKNLKFAARMEERTIAEE